MSKIPSFLNPPGNPEALTDRVLYEWSYEGKHMNEVHAWSCGGAEVPDGLTERVDYLLEVTDHCTGLHPRVVGWCSVARMFLNCAAGGSVPRSMR
jgi:hypothetical protein